MESKLKALKVPDLKEILKKASVPLPPKPTKADLIAKILAEPAAVDVYNASHNPTGLTSQQDAPPKSKSAAKPDVSANPPTSPKKAQDPAPAPQPASATSTTTPTDPAAVEDPELEKRKARAARFGIPLVEPKQPKSTDRKSRRQQLPEDEAKLKTRAERFGVDASAESKKQPARKRGAPEEPADPEELERRKKRAERFGLPLAGASKA